MGQMGVSTRTTVLEAVILEEMPSQVVVSVGKLKSAPRFILTSWPSSNHSSTNLKNSPLATFAERQVLVRRVYPISTTRDHQVKLVTITCWAYAHTTTATAITPQRPRSRIVQPFATRCVQNSSPAWIGWRAGVKNALGGKIEMRGRRHLGV